MKPSKISQYDLSKCAIAKETMPDVKIKTIENNDNFRRAIVTFIKDGVSTEIGYLTKILQIPGVRIEAETMSLESPEFRVCTNNKANVSFDQAETEAKNDAIDWLLYKAFDF